MRRYIDITDIEIPSEENNYDELVEFADAIAEQEIIQLPERKKGKWIHNDSWVNTCSECGMGWNRAFLSDQWNFCPNCGSYNGGEQDED